MADPEKPWTPYPIAPQLDDEEKVTRGALSGIMLMDMFGAGVTAAPAAGHARNVVRLTISALEAYREALDRHRGAIDGRSPYGLFLAANQWEHCITATRRAVRSAEVLRQRLGEWAPEDEVFRIEKSAGVHEAAVRPISEFRDHVEHIEERQGDRMLMLVPRELGLDFGDDHLPYDELAQILGRLAALAVWIDKLNPPPGHPLNGTGAGLSMDEEAKAPFRIE